VEALASGYQEINGTCKKVRFEVGSTESTLFIRIECGKPSSPRDQTYQL